MKKQLENIFSIMSLILIIIILPTLLLILDENNLSIHMQNAGVYERVDYKIAKQELKNILGFFSGEYNLSNNFSESEKQHMHDVKLIIFYIQTILLLSILFLIYYFAKQQNNRTKTKLIKDINLSSKIVIAFGITLLIFILTSFNKTFELFHKIFFPQGNWSFPTNSWIITLFPQQFFINISIQIFITILGLSAILFGATILIKNRAKHIKE